MKEGTYEYLRLIHVDVQQKPIQHCKAIILQLKRKKKKQNVPAFSHLPNGNTNTTFPSAYGKIIIYVYVIEIFRTVPRTLFNMY